MHLTDEQEAGEVMAQPHVVAMLSVVAWRGADSSPIGMGPLERTSHGQIRALRLTSDGAGAVEIDD